MSIQPRIIDAPPTGEIEKESNALIARARAIVVTSQEEYEVAAEFLRGVKTHARLVGDTLAPSIQKAYQTHRELTALRDRLLQPAVLSEGIVKKTMGTYTQEQERIRLERQRYLEAEARRQEEERRLAEAEAMEAEGDHEAAAALIEEPIAPPPVAAPPAVQKAAGISTRKQWKFEVIDVDKVPRAYMVPDLKAIGGVVRSMGDRTTIPGVKVWAEDITSARAF